MPVDTGERLLRPPMRQLRYKVQKPAEASKRFGNRVFASAKGTARAIIGKLSVGC
jgi:hypothetical protein